MFVTDSAMNIAPSLEELRQILQNAVHVAHAVGNNMPKARLWQRVETVNPKMEATVNATLLLKCTKEAKSKVALLMDRLLWITQYHKLPRPEKDFGRCSGALISFSSQQLRPAIFYINH